MGTVWLTNKATGTEEPVPDTDVDLALASGKYAAPDAIAVHRQGVDTYTTPETALRDQTFEPTIDPAVLAAQQGHQIRERANTGVGPALRAFAGGATSGLTFGLVDPYQEEQEFNPLAAVPGQIAGAIAPAFVGDVGGLLGIGSKGARLADDALSLERAGSSLSSKALYTGEAVTDSDRALASAGKAVDRTAAAVTAARDADAAGLTGLDAAGLRAAHESELSRLASEQLAQRTLARSAVVDDVIAYRQTVKDADPWLAISEGEDAARLSKSNKALRSALDDAKGLRENPASLAKPLRTEEQALEGAIKNRAEIAAKLDAVNAKIAEELEKQLPSAPQLPALRRIASETEFRKMQRSFSRDLSAEEESGALEFSKERYNDINRSLRGDSRVSKLAPDDAAVIPALDSALAKSKISEPLITHRAAHFDPGTPQYELKPGDVFTDPGYMSTSWTDDNIHRFGNVHFEITSPPGTKIAAIPSSKTEGELTLARGSTLRVTSRAVDSKGRVTIKAIVESQGDHGGNGAFMRMTDKEFSAFPVDRMNQRQLKSRVAELDARRRELDTAVGRKTDEYRKVRADRNVADDLLQAIKSGKAKEPSGSSALANNPGGSIPASPTTIELTGKAARRYASFADVKLAKGGAITVTAEEAADFAKALRDGRVTGQSQEALGKLDGLLEQNRALQSKIKGATAAVLPKSELVSGRLTAIRGAQDAISSPKAPTTLLQKLAGGSAFGTVAGLAHALPGGSVLAPFLGAKAADLASAAVSGGFRKAMQSSAERAGSAAASFLDVSGKVARTPQVPVLATSTLASLAYDKDKREPQPSTLPALFKARTDEIKNQVHVAADGSFQMRPAARQALASQLRAVRAVDPVVADRLETAGARRIEWLASQIPRRPDAFATSYGPDRWQPSDLDMRSWARKAAAVEDPSAVFDRVVHGTVTPEDAEAMRAVWPEKMQDFIQQVASGLTGLQKALPYSRRMALSLFTGQPVDPALDPKILAVLQNQFPDEPGSQGGTQAPKATPSFGSMPKSPDAPTPSQYRAQGAVQA